MGRTMALRVGAAMTDTRRVFLTHARKGHWDWRLGSKKAQKSWLQNGVCMPPVIAVPISEQAMERGELGQEEPQAEDRTAGDGVRSFKWTAL
jgi:hypothetical protein